jgi:hypothetical protein
LLYQSRHINVGRRRWLIATGFEITPAGRSETERRLLAEFEKWGTIVRNAGIVPE